MEKSLEWELQAKRYEVAQIREDSLDSLIEYPAQKRAIGDVKNKIILDIACGSGRKAYDWILAGASQVYAFDISTAYDEPWPKNKKPENLNIFQCDLNNFHKHKNLQNIKFDIITSLQASGYPTDCIEIYNNIHNFLKPNGVFIYTTAHPMRYASERNEKFSTPIAEAYHDKSPFEYPGTWSKKATTKSHPKTISQRINDLISAGFTLEYIEEPFMNEIISKKYPHKYDWIKKYFGMILYKLRA